MEKVILADQMTDESLFTYHAMMGECCLKVESISPLAIAVWSDVLKELDRRGKVRLISGSYDDIGNALIEDLN